MAFASLALTTSGAKATTATWTGKLVRELARLVERTESGGVLCPYSSMHHFAKDAALDEAIRARFGAAQLCLHALHAQRVHARGAGVFE
ncbi:hypothetical protein [Limnohabitans sp.]|uniref:hypothetical protein n=1 Tax=Limnohabitans sp. TaxID=1907725 RepID=UPI0025C1F8F6|nr:hypothetical protein [Limnohabitans sp.]